MSIFFKRIFNKILNIGLIFVLIVGSLIVTACDSSPKENILLGAPVIIYVDDQNYNNSTKLSSSINNDLANLSSRLNFVFSVEENSQMSAYNTVIGGKSVKVDQEFYYVFNTFKSFYSMLNGNINPQVKLLVDLWGFSKVYKDINYAPTKPFDREMLSSGGFPLPEKKYIEGFTTLSDFSKTNIELVNGEYILTKPDLKVTIDGTTYYSQLDFSSAVKGYYCDLAVQKLSSYGIKSYYISAGGSSMYLSSLNLEPWRLGVVNPFSKTRDNLLKIKVKDKFVSTSGIYENNYEVDGKLYCHIIDGKTGKPTTSDIASVTIICDSGINSDILSTALVNMGVDGAKQFISQKSLDFDYIIVTKNKEIISNLSDIQILVEGFSQVKWE